MLRQRSLGQNGCSEANEVLNLMNRILSTTSMEVNLPFFLGICITPISLWTLDFFFVKDKLKYIQRTTMILRGHKSMAYKK